MTRPRRKRRTRAAQPRWTPQLADARVDRLRGRSVPSRSAPEDLDGLADPAVRVTSRFPDHKLELLVRGQPVSSITIVDFQQQIGSQVLRMGGVAGVGTRPEHRFRGYGRRVMEGALRWMRREGFDVTMLYGIPSYYTRFGYAQAFPGVRFTVAVRDAERAARKGYRFVRFARRYLPAVLRMYHASNAGRTGPTRRDPRHWRPFRKGLRYDSAALCKVALDARGRPVGYFVHDAGHLTAAVIEIGFARSDVFGDILRAAARHALRRRLEQIQLHLPEDDPFLEFCKPLGIRKEVTFRGDGGAQVRMIHIPRALGKLAADLGSRGRGTGRLTIRTNLDDVGLRWSHRALTIGRPHRSGPQARMPQWALAQLLYGYRTAEALAAAGTLKASRQAVDALCDLFPLRPHFHYLADHF